MKSLVILLLLIVSLVGLVSYCNGTHVDVRVLVNSGEQRVAPDIAHTDSEMIVTEEEKGGDIVTDGEIEQESPQVEDAPMEQPADSPAPPATIPIPDPPVSTPIPSLPHPIVSAPAPATQPASGSRFVDTSKPSIVSALESGARTRGISSANVRTHLLRIVNQFNVYQARQQLARPTELLAYILATAELETGRFKWMAEIGGSRKRYAPYYGRGYVQLTHRANYQKYDTKLKGVNLLQPNESIVSNPNFLSSNSERARDCMAYVIIDGMLTGAFTGKKLSTYINANKVDYTGARRVVNGRDKAAMIAGYARAWQAIIDKARRS